MNPDKIEAVFMQTTGVIPSAQEIQAIMLLAETWGVNTNDAGMMMIVQNRAMQYALGSMPARIQNATDHHAVQAAENATAAVKNRIRDEVASLVPTIRDDLSKAIKMRMWTLTWVWALGFVLVGAMLTWWIWTSAYRAGADWQNGIDTGNAGMLARYEASPHAVRAAAELEAKNPGILENNGTL